MKKNLVFIFILALSIIIPVLTQAQEVSPAAEFKLEGLDKNIYALSDYRGKKAVVLLFWTTWCPYCRQEVRALNDKYKQLSDDGVEVLLINTGEPKFKIENFFKNQALNFKVLMDTSSTVADMYGVMGIPTYIFVTKEGYIVFNNHYFPEGKYREFLLE